MRTLLVILSLIATAAPARAGFEDGLAASMLTAELTESAEMWARGWRPRGV